MHSIVVLCACTISYRLCYVRDVLTICLGYLIAVSLKRVVLKRVVIDEVLPYRSCCVTQVEINTLP